MFLNNSEWFRFLYLPYNSCSTGSLKTWIQRHRHQVETYIAAPVLASASPAKAQPLQVLRALMCPGSQLSRVSMPTSSGSQALQSLASFTALASCTLHNPHQQNVGEGVITLLPLGSLNHLRQLSLQGPAKCTNLGAVQNLTKLAVSDTMVYDNSRCTLATKLRSLFIQNGTIIGHNSPGLFACEQLQEFGCIHSKVTADNREDTLCTDNEGNMDSQQDGSLDAAEVYGNASQEMKQGQRLRSHLGWIG